MAQPHTGNPTTGDPWLDLFAAIFRQAIKDAKRGDTDAHHFLDHTLPEWRQIEESYIKETNKQWHDSQQQRPHRP